MASSNRYTSMDLFRAMIKGTPAEKLNAHIFPDGDKNKKEKKAKKVSKPKSEPLGLKFIKDTLDELNIEYIEELRFHEFRKFRFDVAITNIKVAIEYEGVFSEKSRHTSFQGYSTDASKYNLAQINGWRVFRYTAMNYESFKSDIKTILNTTL